MMQLRKMHQAACVLAALAASIAPIYAQMTPQSAYAADAKTLGDKFAGLAKVLDGKYDYRPGQGVRSTAEVLNMIVMENGMLSALLTGAAPGARPAPISDPAKMQEAIKASSESLQKAIDGLSSADLNATVKLFGRDMPKIGAVTMLLADQHEHLGQLIAYSRVNGIVPPWSK